VVTVRWGVAGPGGIAERFAAAMTTVPDGHIAAVASRSSARAIAFAERHGVPRPHGSYDALCDDPAVDVVYVAVPHAGHEELTVAALDAGKHVLCEKPLALHAGQAQRMVDAARRNGRFLMEAMWSRFLPAYGAIADLVGSGRIGRALVVESDFGFRMPVTAGHRLFDPALGGGAALDLGIYPLQLASFVLGPPVSVQAAGSLGTTGVDELAVFTTTHADGGIGVGKAAIRLGLSCTGRISGEEGWIDIPAFAHDPRHLHVTVAGATEVLDCDYDGDGLRFEIEAVHRCVAEGRIESDVMPLEDSLALARALDAVRAAIGVVYPGDSP
jgi:predicted dehydrogenase